MIDRVPDQRLVRRETGKEQAVQVRHDEGVAIHIGPEPCADVREDVGEASAGECAGQPLSRESDSSGCRRGKLRGRQHGWARQRECSADPAWSETLACTEALCTGTGRSPARPPVFAKGGPYREGEEP
jgi:hypothetical protein